jgi:hypothetical protein
MAGCSGTVTRAGRPAPGNAAARRGPVAALGDLFIICVVGFVIVAVLSLVLAK